MYCHALSVRIGLIGVLKKKYYYNKIFLIAHRVSSKIKKILDFEVKMICFPKLHLLCQILAHNNTIILYVCGICNNHFLFFLQLHNNNNIVRVKLTLTLYFPMPSHLLSIKSSTSQCFKMEKFDKLQSFSFMEVY